MAKKTLRTILVVEDDEKISAKIHSHILNVFNRQVQIKEAKTMKDAEKVLDQGMVDISIIDFALPDGDGENLIARIRKESRYHPIIAQTTNVDMQYRIKIYEQYYPIMYITKDVLFERLTECLTWAVADLEFRAPHRLSVSSAIGSMDINEVCYIKRMMNTNHLHVELYDFDQEAYKSVEIKNMSLAQFMKKYNKTGYFIRCHNSYIVNKKMIKDVDRTNSEIVMLHPCKDGYLVRVEMSVNGKYRKDVLAQTEGVY